MRNHLRTCLLALLVLVAFTATACDAYTEYTILNESDEEIGTGWFYGDCTAERELDKRDGPLDLVIAPGDDLTVGYVTAGFPDCIAVRTRDDEIALIAKYESEGVYVVSGSRSDNSLSFRFLGKRP